MPVDASIPLQAKLPDNMGSLASIMNTANTMLSAKRQGVAYQQEQGALNARKAVASVVSDPKYRDPATGLINMDAIAPAIVQADPMNYVASDAISSMAKFNNDLITVKKSALGLSDAARSTVASAIGSYANDPTVTRDKVEAGLDDLVAQAPVTKPIVDVWKRHLDAMPDDPKAIQSFAINARGQVMPASTQAQVQTPSGVPVSTGQVTSVVNTNPNAAIPVGAPIPGTTVQQQLPPTTPVFNNATNQPGYLGPQPAAAAPGATPGPAAGGGAPALPAGAPPSSGPETQIPPAEQDMRNQYQLKVLLAERAKEANNPDVAARAQNLAAIDKEIASVQGEKPGAPAPARSGFVASGPPLGTAENIAGTVDAVNKDWNNTLENARTASQDIGVLQNIKQYAPGAAMGVVSERRAFIAGVAGLLGMDAGEIQKTNTDLLAKNASMLALRAGNTDMSRVLGEMSNPNFHMTKESAIDAANQVIAQRKLALVKQKFMGNFKGDPEQYTKELADFNKFADPRILQLPDMSRDEMARMKAAMTPSQQKDFGQKIRKMQAMGLIQ